MVMIGARGTISRGDMQAIRQLLDSYPSGNWSRTSAAHKHLNIGGKILNLESPKLRNYIPVIHMCM